MALPMYLGIGAIIGAKMVEIMLAPFRKQNSNISRKDAKFGTDLFDSMMNTLHVLELANLSWLFTAPCKHYHTQ